MKSKQYFSLLHPGKPGNWVFVLALVLGIGLANVNAQTTYSLFANGQVHRIESAGNNAQTFTLPSNVTQQYIFIIAEGADGGHAWSKDIWGNFHNGSGGEGATVSAYLKIGTGPNEIPPGSTFRLIVGKAGEGKHITPLTCPTLTLFLRCK